MDKQQLLNLIKRLEQGEEIPVEEVPEGKRTWKRYWVPDSMVFSWLMRDLKDFEHVADGRGVQVYACPSQCRLVIYTEGDVDVMQYASLRDFWQGLARHAAFYARCDRGVFAQIADYCRSLSVERSGASLEIE